MKVGDVFILTHKRSGKPLGSDEVILFAEYMRFYNPEKDEIKGDGILTVVEVFHDNLYSEVIRYLHSSGSTYTVGIEYIDVEVAFDIRDMQLTPQLVTEA